MLRQFERHGQRLIPFNRFLVRMAWFGGLALLLDAGLIVIGTIGFHALEPISWMRAALNAGLVLTGNGPLVPASSTASELFELLFAVIGGITFLIVATVILVPVVHRVLHVFNLEPEATPKPARRDKP